MVFSRLFFLYLFLPLCLLCYFLTPSIRAKNVVLLVFSLLFYAWGEPVYIFLMLAMAGVNYGAALLLEKRHARAILALALGADLLCLAIFKYSAFLVENFNALTGLSVPVPGLALPIGISFYTFQALSYVVDVWRGQVRAQRSFFRYLLYLSMFPQLIAGPIVRYADVEAQLDAREEKPAEMFYGATRFCMGRAKKVLLADPAGKVAAQLLGASPASGTTLGMWLGVTLYMFEIYFDFSGYSDMAIGMGRIFGFRFPENFRLPYTAKSITEFWRRWHISLSSFFRDYVYIPLGGNRKGDARTVLNLLVVWILTAAWHGSTLNFMLWGLFLWFFIVLERTVEKAAKALRKRRTAGKAAEALQKRKTAGKAKQRHFGIFSHLYLWAVIPVTWMCFANEDFSQLKIYLGRMFGLLPGVNVNAADWKKAISNYGFLLLCCFVFCTPIVRRWYGKWKNSVIGYLVLILLFWLSVWRVIVAGENTFMYLRF